MPAKRATTVLKVTYVYRDESIRSEGLRLCDSCREDIFGSIGLPWCGISDAEVIMWYEAGDPTKKCEECLRRST